ncbi:MAG: class I SAM-dependent methyltransferase [Chloroflexi bacterium]|nr:class I SAM-dependent methyltransferase [Chloroflexota bacterium]
MKPETIQGLVAVNRAFYSRFAHAFSETRPSGQAHLRRIVEYIPTDVRVLDVGCGNGRLAEQLERAGRTGLYFGVDSSQELIDIARSRATGLVRLHSQFDVVDITFPGWKERVVKSSGTDAFDVVTMLAVLQHVPGAETRRDVLREIHDLLRPGGVLIMTNWQFLRNERTRKRVQAWTLVGMDGEELEPGDALLDWKRGGLGYRYCHQLSPEEVEKLAAQSHLSVRDQFYADGELNLYGVLERPIG